MKKPKNPIKLKSEIKTMKSIEILRITDCNGRTYFWDGVKFWRGKELKGLK